MKKNVERPVPGQILRYVDGPMRGQEKLYLVDQDYPENPYHVPMDSWAKEKGKYTLEQLDGPFTEWVLRFKPD